MRAIRFVYRGTFARTMIGCLAIVLAFALLAFNVQPTATANPTQDMPDSPQATFPANAPSLGAVPDGPGAAGTCGTAKDVTFTVAGMSAPLTNVELSLNMTHSWVGDIEASLLAPGLAPSHLLFARTGATTAASFGDSSDLLGPYNFKDSAVGTHWWTAAANEGTGAAPVPAGDYRSVATGPSATPPAQTTITTTFSGLTAGQVNGQWTLRLRDCGAGDTGTVSAATLTLVGGSPVVPQHIVDFDGDGKTDPAVVRNTGGGAGGQETWFILNSSGAPSTTTTPWGISTDFFVPEDYDGDGKTDIAVWRGGAPFNSFFYILQSTTGTLRIDTFGQSGDDPTVIGDYDGDNKADPAVYRGGAAAGDHSFWYYRSSISGLIIGTEWGQNGDFPAPGDYDGDGKFDFNVQRNNGGGQARFFLRQTTAGDTSVVFGTPTDLICPGDYDGDGKYDIATVRGSGGQYFWSILRSFDGVTNQAFFGASATDFLTQGDWDGDGKTDIAVWRPNADPLQNFFYVRSSGTGTDSAIEWGQLDDYPVANYNTH